MKRRSKSGFRAALGGSRGIGLIEILIVAFAVIVLSAMVAPAMFAWISDSEVARAQGDAMALAAAMTRFWVDTGRWPGQAEILQSGSSTRFLIVGNPEQVTFPTGVSGIGSMTCSNGLLGVVPGVTSFAPAIPSTSNTLDLMDFLVRKPAAASYPNWRGPYVPVQLRSDPWGRAWIINVIPLFCGEPVSELVSGGEAGFGWILSGGPNRTLQTPFTATRLEVSSDDAGVNLSKR